jgi:hypothetical protein
MQSIRREWREGKVRPIPGNPPHDRPVSRGNSFTFWKICDDPFPATPHPPQATLARPFAFFRHGGIYRSDGVQNQKPKHAKLERGCRLPLVGPPCPVKDATGGTTRPAHRPR